MQKSGYVLKLPSRPPVVLARSVASLVLLSPGRVALGLGLGDTFAVAASGGARRTPARAVTALSGAIDIIRGILDTSATRLVHLGSEPYHVSGAERGPKAAHDIPIWVPAGGPRMRRLAQKAEAGSAPGCG